MQATVGRLRKEVVAGVDSSREESQRALSISRGPAPAMTGDYRTSPGILNTRKVGFYGIAFGGLR